MNCNKIAFDGYQEARAIDEIINELIRVHGIDHFNASEWLKLARTIQTSCNILYEYVKSLIDVQPILRETTDESIRSIRADKM